jgi:hypothetical protein
MVWKAITDALEWDAIIMVIFTVALLMIMFKPSTGEPRTVEVGNYKCKHFDTSGGMSLEVLKKMQSDGLCQERLEEFATLEDEFLYLERQTVCGGKSFKVPMMELDRKIRDRFAAYDFKYHNMHIKQASEPTKQVNPWITCIGGIPEKTGSS